MLTDMNQALADDPAFNALVVGRTLSRRWGRPEELIGAAVLLASAASDCANGQVISVDGGMLAVAGMKNASEEGWIKRLKTIKRWMRGAAGPASAYLNAAPCLQIDDRT